jgi:pimeloyl-ACP methyl ester carboxylesterase
VVLLLAGGHGGLRLFDNGTPRWGDNNFLVRSRALFAEQGLAVAVLDVPSDRQRPPFLEGFRQTAEHAADLKATLAWLRSQWGLPVWLVGTSRGTQSVAFVATELAGPEGPDGIVLSSSILTDERSRAVPAMPLERIRVPVLVLHHERDGCRLCAFSQVPALMDGLKNAPRKHCWPSRAASAKATPATRWPTTASTASKPMSCARPRPGCWRARPMWPASPCA